MTREEAYKLIEDIAQTVHPAHEPYVDENTYEGSIDLIIDLTDNSDIRDFLIQGMYMYICKLLKENNTIKDPEL